MRDLQANVIQSIKSRSAILFHHSYISSLVSAYSNIPIFIALHPRTDPYTRNMASLWLLLSVILCIITEIVAIPLRIAPQEEEYLSFGKKLEESLSRQR